MLEFQYLIHFPFLKVFLVYVMYIMYAYILIHRMVVYLFNH